MLPVLGMTRAGAQDLPALILIGDSTGWGEPLAQYFDPTKIKVTNRALGGRSSY